MGRFGLPKSSMSCFFCFFCLAKFSDFNLVVFSSSFAWVNAALSSTETAAFHCSMDLLYSSWRLRARDKYFSFSVGLTRFHISEITRNTSVGESDGCARLTIGRLTAIYSSQALVGLFGISGSSVKGRIVGAIGAFFALAPSSSAEEWKEEEEEEEEERGAEEEAEEKEDDKRNAEN